jgi:hypothetical protein
MVRIVTAVAALISAAVHFILWWFEDYRAIDMIGPAFLLNAVAGLVIAVMLLTWRHWIPAFLVTGFGLSTLGAFVLSATVGLFGVHETWSGGWVLTAAASEVVCIVGGLLLLRAAWPIRLRAAHDDVADPVRH